MARKKPITRIEVTAAFWKDLAGLRRHPDYWKIRAGIHDVVKERIEGGEGRDVMFTGARERWQGIHHAHICSKLIVFTGYPREGVMRLCAIAKHDSYGFRNERASMAGQTAARLNRSLDTPSAARPGWSCLKWRDPGDIRTHPELPELSDEGLHQLLRDILEESQTFAMLDDRLSGLSLKLQNAFAEAWMSSLIDAQEAIETEILDRARNRRDSLCVADIKRWAPRENVPGLTF